MENFYDIALEINVEKQFINSIINLKYLCDLERKKELIFYIHKDIEIEEITCNVIICSSAGSFTKTLSIIGIIEAPIHIRS